MCIYFYLKLCKELFGDSFTPEYIESLVSGTNVYYGAKDIDVDKVLFVHGSFDPWHAIGITNGSEKYDAILVEGMNSFLMLSVHIYLVICTYVKWKVICIVC